MPTVRKISPEQAAEWELDLAPFVLEAMIARIAGDDRVGLTRLDYPEHGSVGWSARVYGGGKEYTHFFSDAANGGPEPALRLAASWRNEMRRHVPRAPRQRRIVRIQKPEQRLVGYFAWRGSDKKRRYFSDAAHGGPEGAMRAAAAWAQT
jgi:hypothetical protein